MMSVVAVHLAECVAALWRLGPKGHESIPDVYGIIDKAIEQVCREIPALRQKITFSNTGVGRRCLDWPEAASFLQASGMAEVDGTTFTALTIKISPSDAYQILRDHNLSKGQRKRLSDQFHRWIERGRKTIT